MAPGKCWSAMFQIHSAPSPITTFFSAWLQSAVDVARRREPYRGMSRQILEKAGKTLKRNGGDDGARTPDLRRDRRAVRNSENLCPPKLRGEQTGSRFGEGGREENCK